MSISFNICTGEWGVIEHWINVREWNRVGSLMGKWQVFGNNALKVAVLMLHLPVYGPPC